MCTLERLRLSSGLDPPDPIPYPARDENEIS